MSNNKLQLFVKVQSSVNTNIDIGSSGTSIDEPSGDWIEVDLYKDESINFVDSIQDVKDI